MNLLNIIVPDISHNIVDILLNGIILMDIKSEWTRVQRQTDARLEPGLNEWTRVEVEINETEAFRTSYPIYKLLCCILLQTNINIVVDNQDYFTMYDFSCWMSQ
jgi:hypothetical protein